MDGRTTTEQSPGFSCIADLGASISRRAERATQPGDVVATGGDDRPADADDEASRRSSDGDPDSPVDRSVVFVTQQYPPDRSGHASRMRDTATALADRGWDVTVLAAPPSFPPGEFERSWRPVETDTVDGVTVHRLWTWQPASPDPGFLTRMAYYVVFAAFAALWTALVRRDDVVVTSTPPISTGVAGFPAALLGRRWVVDVRDLWIDASVSLGFIADGGLLERASRRFQRAVLATADSVAVTTPTLGESLCEQYGDRLAEKTLLVPNGVDISRFQSRTDGRGAVAPGHPTTERPPVDRDEAADRFEVVYTGNIGHAQDLESCVRALEHLPDRVVLRLVGGGDAVPTLRRLAEERGVGHRVEFAGTVPHDQIPSILARAQVGVAPLADDPELAYAMPTKVYEYLGARLPVVATGRGELERFVEESGGGIHADNDPESVAAAIRRLTDDELRAECGREGFRHVRREYDRATIAARLSDHLETLVADSARAS